MERQQERYKLSFYNVFYDIDDVQYMWNTYSGALLKLDKAAQEYVRSFTGIDDGSNEFHLLKSNGFSVYENIDEFGRICLKEKQEMFSRNSNTMVFRIALGMGCNYSCSYCFENTSDISGAMTSEIAEDVAEYICKQIRSNPTIKNISITWFGGEPLLYMDALEAISKRVIDYTLQNEIKFTAGIITNGRFLDANALEKLYKFNVGNAQITLDGMQDAYCQNKNASPDDFNRVIENIIYASDKMRLIIRLNIPDNDADEAIAITDYLLSQHGLIGKIRVYLAFVKKYSLDTNEAKESFISFLKNSSIWVCHMIDNYSISEIRSLIPMQRSTHCGLIKTNNVCIGAEGELYRCSGDFGKTSKITGDIWNGRFFNDVEFTYYTTLDMPHKHKHRNCKYVPICMGRCMSDCLLGYDGHDCKAYQQWQFKLKLLEGGVEYAKLFLEYAGACN